MALIDWNEKLSVGVAKFDEEHKKLVEMLNSLHDAMKQGKGKERLLPLLDELVQYTKQHFIHEEQIMLQKNYPGYELHRKEHEALVKEVMVFQTQLVSGKNVLSSQVFQFLKEWVIKHIGQMDKEYGVYIRKLNLINH